VVFSQEKPPEAPTPPAGAKSAFDPKKVLLVSTRWKPWGEWTTSTNVRLRSSDLATANSQLEKSNARLTGVGEQAPIRVTRIVQRQGLLEAKVEVDGIPRAGDYAGTLSVDPLDDKAAALEVTVKARHAFYFPVIALVLGMLLGVGGTSLYEIKRRRDVLRLALVDAGSWLQFTTGPNGLYTLQKELIGDDINADLFPSGTGCKGEQAKPALVKLYCDVGRARLRSTLDSRAVQVEQMLARIERWYRAGVALTALRKAVDLLPADAPASARSQSETLVNELAQEPTDDSELLLARVNAQAGVLEALAAALREWRVRPEPDKDPASVYRQFPSAAERTLDESRKLRVRLLDLRAELAARPDPTRRVEVMLVSTEQPFVGAPPWSIATGAQTLSEAEAQQLEPPWAGDTGGLVISRRIRTSIRTADVAAFLAHATVAVVAFLIPLYIATTFGSWSDYAAVFAAGFLGKVALDKSLSPFRSTKLGPSSQGEKAAKATGDDSVPTPEPRSAS
jgi:hypothetical protein